jgi:hypothetical protein
MIWVQIAGGVKRRTSLMAKWHKGRAPDRGSLKSVALIVPADRQLRQLAVNTLNESIYASFAPVESQLFVRTTRHLYCFQKAK